MVALRMSVRGRTTGNAGRGRRITLGLEARRRDDAQPRQR